MINEHVGINPKLWGPHFWKTLFYTALNFPVKIDQNNKCHSSLKKHYKSFYAALQHTLPCIYCLESYRRFWIESPIDNYLDSRIDLLKWLYILRDKVNKKLIFQEKQCLQAEKKILLEKFAKKYGPKSKWTKAALALYNTGVDRLTRKIIKTESSPSWKEAVEQFNNMR